MTVDTYASLTVASLTTGLRVECDAVGLCVLADFVEEYGDGEKCRRVIAALRGGKMVPTTLDVKAVECLCGLDLGEEDGYFITAVVIVVDVGLPILPADYVRLWRLTIAHGSKIRNGDVLDEAERVHGAAAITSNG